MNLKPLPPLPRRLEEAFPLKSIESKLVFPMRPLQAGVPRSFSGIAGLIWISAGMMALAAWSVLPAAAIRHIWILSQVHPYSALGFALVGLALRLDRFSRASRWVFRACKLFRISVGLLGLLTLAEAW